VVSRRRRQGENKNQKSLNTGLIIHESIIEGGGKQGINQRTKTLGRISVRGGGGFRGCAPGKAAGGGKRGRRTGRAAEKRIVNPGKQKDRPTAESLNQGGGSRELDENHF